MSHAENYLVFDVPKTFVRPDVQRQVRGEIFRLRTINKTFYTTTQKQRKSGYLLIDNNTTVNGTTLFLH